MSMCEYEVMAPGEFKCKHCGDPVRAPQTDPTRVYRECTVENNYIPPHWIGLIAPMRGPTIVRRLSNFTVAAIGHYLKGSPTCSQEQIDERLAICKQCPLFNGKICTHEKCGCNVKDTRGYLNKLAWADQQCPLDPPKWTRVDL